jgi:amino acid transporter
MHFGVWPDNSEVVSASSRFLASSTLRIWMMRKEHRIRIHSSFVLLSISYTALAAFVSSMYFQAYLYPGFVGLTVFGWIRLHLHRPYPRESRFVRLAVFVSIVGAFFSPFFSAAFSGQGLSRLRICFGSCTSRWGYLVLFQSCCGSGEILLFWDSLHRLRLPPSQWDSSRLLH